MSEHAVVKEAHRKFTERLIFASMSSYAKAAQLLADFERDARLKEAQLWEPLVETGQFRNERIEQLKRGEL